ncbi:phage holin, LLH family [Clostridium sp. OS1-26]|uniref:phage holin, LLH family n=1 Tax=Clostridium sp. OS1-26 TaxID=3070681 RepID=UPI0027E192E0|nr:phage holin, LLH family [Clostridium sp. OS1-26]WML35655.1 phage holin, LLH family [Clostridium sp. OS1-26]
MNFAKVLDEWIEKGVKGAQQLYYSGHLKGEDRNKVAKDAVYTALKQFGIEPDEEQQKLINVAIEAAVNDLEHNKTEAEKLSAQQQLQSQVSQLQQENSQLKQTITQVQNTIGVPQMAQ